MSHTFTDAELDQLVECCTSALRAIHTNGPLSTRTALADLLRTKRLLINRQAAAPISNPYLPFMHPSRSSIAS